MAELEKAQERIQAICEKIRIETLEPAKLQAQEIIEHAHKEAEKIRKAAKHDAEKIHAELKKQLEEEKRIFNSSLEQASKQTIESVKQKIESALFNPALEKWVHAQLGGAKEEAKLISVIIKAIEKNGLQTEFAVEIPQAFTPEEIIANMSTDILKRLGANAIEVSDIKGGAKIVLKNKHMTLDVSEAVFKELISSFIRKDFRKLFFTN